MAIGDPYATLQEFKKYLSIQTSTDDERLSDALESASREVEDFCHRQFNKVSTATSRVFTTPNQYFVSVDDFYTTDDLVVESGNVVGTFDQTWGAEHYELRPLNGLSSGRPWVYDRIRPLGGRSVSNCGRLRVTAHWGWAEVPAPVKQSTLIIAAQTFKLSESPLGVAGFAEFGVVRVRAIPQAYEKLCRYVKSPVLVG